MYLEEEDSVRVSNQVYVCSCNRSNTDCVKRVGGVGRMMVASVAGHFDRSAHDC